LVVKYGFEARALIGSSNASITEQRQQMALEDFPAPSEGFAFTHFLVVSDQDRSGEFYRSLFSGRAVSERDPVVLKVVPLINRSVATRLVRNVLDAVSARLGTTTLACLDAEVQDQHQDPGAVAEEFLHQSANSA
jgi:hypothetical protein